MALIGTKGYKLPMLQTIPQMDPRTCAGHASLTGEAENIIEIEIAIGIAIGDSLAK